MILMMKYSGQRIHADVKRKQAAREITVLSKSKYVIFKELKLKEGFTGRQGQNLSAKLTDVIKNLFIWAHTLQSLDGRTASAYPA